MRGSPPIVYFVGQMHKLFARETTECEGVAVAFPKQPIRYEKMGVTHRGWSGIIDKEARVSASNRVWPSLQAICTIGSRRAAGALGVQNG